MVKKRTPAEIKADLEAKRKAIEEQTKATLAKLDAKLAKASVREKAQGRKDDAHLKIVMGAAVQAHARIDPAFLAQLRAALNRAVVKDRDRELVEGWFEALAKDQQAQAAE